MTSPGAARGASARHSLGLRAVHPPEVEGWLEVGVGGTVVGRAHGLAHPTVSRRHLSLRAAGLVLEVRDEGSHNGTWLNGAKLGAEAMLAGAGSVLRMGDVLAVIETREDDDDAVDRDALPGDAPTMRALRRMLGRIAPGPAHVLLLGETGSGKELAAREVHRLSGRGELVAFNCAGLTPQLADSQLFGHLRGAFTGADQAREGLFRRADGGTLFLDEVAELAPEVQAKLLRVLETGEVQPLGSDAVVRTDVRVVAATHPDLPTRVREGRFRRDLYARLSLATAQVPPLRDRRGDIPGWIGILEAGWRAKDPGPPLAWTPEALEAAMLAPWEDNLRGLDRAVYQLRAQLGAGATVTRDALEAIGVTDTEEPSAAPPRDGGPRGTRPAKPSKDELARVLSENGGSVRATAKHFERDRRQIYRWMEAYGLRGEDEGT